LSDIPTFIKKTIAFLTEKREFVVIQNLTFETTLLKLTRSKHFS
jgi:hypothetical protein